MKEIFFYLENRRFSIMGVLTFGQFYSSAGLLKLQWNQVSNNVTKPPDSVHVSCEQVNNALKIPVNKSSGVIFEITEISK